jgi:hypothetical protein
MVRFSGQNVDFDSRRGHTCPTGEFDLANLVVKNGNTSNFMSYITRPIHPNSQTPILL